MESALFKHPQSQWSLSLVEFSVNYHSVRLVPYKRNAFYGIFLSFQLSSVTVLSFMISLSFMVCLKGQATVLTSAV